MTPSKRISSCPIACTVVCVFLLPCAVGCSLFAGGSRKPSIESTPPYYSSSKKDSWQGEKDNMANQTKHFRQAETEWNRMEELSRDEKQKRTEDRCEEELHAKKKKSWWSYSGNDEKFLRSNEAAKIHSNLER